MSAVGLPDSFFTAPPHWHWLVILYFFIGGLAGGCYVLAALADLFGEPDDRRLARAGYAIAFGAIVISGLLLILDLGRPLRFWHMLVQSHTGRPMLKPWSPMSLGSWALLIFGGFAFLSFLAALADEGRVPWPRLKRLRPPGILGTVLVSVGGLLALFVAGYTGVLLSVTNRPIWSDTWLLGLVFTVSAASISTALLLLVAYWRGWLNVGVYALKRFEGWVLLLELIAIVALVASLGVVAARVWLNAWGAGLVLVVLVGIVVPLALSWRLIPAGRLTTPVASALVLVGGFLLRVVLVLSSEGVRLGSLVLLGVGLVAATTGCSSPEATRMRSGGPGADPGNRGPIVRMHEGSEPYHDTTRLTLVPGPPLAPASQAKMAEKPRS
jgi:formate-dependent nitrite reductase membrane component NrfD